MRYYYSIKGEAKGPVEEEELRQLAEEGIIKAGTPVIAVGGTAWSRYSELFGGSVSRIAKPPVKRKVQSESFLNKLLGINTWTDKFLERIFRLPSFIPSDFEGRMRAMEKMANFTGLIIWIGAIITALSFGLSVSGVGMIVGLLAGLLYGFLIQYIGYQIYSITNSLLIGQPVLLSSSRFPKLIGTLMMVITLVVAGFTLISAKGIGGIFIALCAILPCVVLTYLCMNSDGLLVKVSPSEVSPGREFNNSIKFLIRAIIASVHVLTPVLVVLAALSAFFTVLTIDSQNVGYGSLMSLVASSSAVLILLHLPLFTWLLLCLSSWLLDLLDSAFAMGCKNSD